MERLTFFREKLLVILMFSALILVGCGVSGSGVLNNGKIYSGQYATHEIIEVQSKDEWIIKDKKEDDSTYTVATVTETGENIADYPVIEIKGIEVYGEGSRFAPREGKQFIYVETEETIHFRRVMLEEEEHTENLTKELMDSDDPDALVIDHSSFDFIKP